MGNQRRLHWLSLANDIQIKNGQGFLLVFSITSMSSLYELTKLREEIQRIKEDGAFTRFLN
jgi:hypothetical protein